ncbi:hypothetical protein [Herbaspirillum huttiense]|uniref:hypothetical protein n=1 Tax=Herbaspirillum huttiense TaxID=863372 RepID=UPI0039B0A24F
MKINAKRINPPGNQIDDAIRTKVRLYDNGGKTLDRYTSLYLFDPVRPGAYGSRSMNSQPYQGIGCYGEAMPGRHLGRRVQLNDMPGDCQRLIRSDVSAYLSAVHSAAA